MNLTHTRTQASLNSEFSRGKYERPINEHLALAPLFHRSLGACYETQAFPRLVKMTYRLSCLALSKLSFVTWSMVDSPVPRPTLTQPRDNPNRFCCASVLGYMKGTVTRNSEWQEIHTEHFSWWAKVFVFLFFKSSQILTCSYSAWRIYDLSYMCYNICVLRVLGPIYTQFSEMSSLIMHQNAMATWACHWCFSLEIVIFLHLKLWCLLCTVDWICLIP